MARRFMVPVALAITAVGPMAATTTAPPSPASAASTGGPEQAGGLPAVHAARLGAVLPLNHNPHAPPDHGPPTNAPSLTTAPPRTTAPPATTAPPQTAAPMTAPPPTVKSAPATAPPPVVTFPSASGGPPNVQTPQTSSSADVRAELPEAAVAGFMADVPGSPPQEAVGSVQASQQPPALVGDATTAADLTTVPPIDVAAAAGASAAGREAAGAPLGMGGGGASAESRPSKLLGTLIVLFGIFVGLCALGRWLWRSRLGSGSWRILRRRPTGASDGPMPT